MPAPAPTPVSDRAVAARAAQVRVWSRVAGCAGLFLALVGLAMVGSHLRLKANDPWKSPVLLELKNRLRETPKDDSIKEQIRALDLQLRARYFRILAFNGTGIWFLLGGLAVFAAASGRLMHLRRTPPLPGARPDPAVEARREVRLSRWAVGGTAATVTLAFVGLSLAMDTALPRQPEDWKKLVQELGGGRADGAETIDAAPVDEMRGNWPRFLGQDGSSLAATNAPVKWDGATGEGIAWKVPVPLPGFNSPIVWGDRVFLAGGDEKQREVICFNARDGSIAWRQPVDKVPGSPVTPDIPEMTGYAPATAATDGRRVYAMFPNGDLAAFTLEGRLVWAKNLGLPDNAYGHTSSLITWQDRVIVQLDQGEAENNKSRLIALQGRTGQVLWQRQRPVGSSWASPTVFEHAGRGQIVALALPWAIAYSVSDGTELWRVEGLTGEVTPSPAYAAGLVLVASPSDQLLAIRPDGNGDVTKTHVAWTSNENVPDVTSPAAGGEFVFTVTTIGMLTCFDGKDGKKLWEKDLDTEVHASPAVAGGHVYIFTQKGLAVVAEAAREYKEVNRTTMLDGFHASPAIADGRIYVRGLTNLWCIGPAQPATPRVAVTEYGQAGREFSRAMQNGARASRDSYLTSRGGGSWERTAHFLHGFRQAVARSHRARWREPKGARWRHSAEMPLPPREWLAKAAPSVQ